MTLPTINPTKETDKIADFIKESFVSANKSKAVIALSGGIDSATSFMLTVKALGVDNILPLHLPSRHSNPIHTKDVNTLLQSANFPINQLTTINIGSIIQKTWRIINHYSDAHQLVVSVDKFAPSSQTQTSQPLPPGTPDRRAHNAQLATTNRLRLANIAARTRMVVIYDYAKQHDALVVGTENYSEHLLGYFTRFGDEASDLEPIRHLYKTHVRQLAQHLGVPVDILTKAPSADLWIGQSDENEMGFSYEQADPILYLFDHGKTVDQIMSEGFDPKLVNAILSQVKANHFKHEVPYHLA